MQLRDWLVWTRTALGESPSRSLLTSSGIAIGICAVVLLTSIGEGIRIYLLDSFSQFGTRIIAVTPGKTTTGGVSSGGLLSTVRPLSLDDAEALRRLPHVAAVVPVVQGTARIEAGRYARDTDIYGVGPDIKQAWGFAVSSGQFLPSDGTAARYFAVLGAKVKEELFGHRNALGEFVRIGGSRYRVIGMMESKGQLLGFDLDDAVYIPAALGLQMFNRESLMEVDVVFRQSTTSAAMSDAIKALMIARHGDEDVTLFTQEDMLSSLDRILGMLKIAIGALGVIALVVGGVGVLTIMSMALRERIPEIGVLRALGCTKATILWMFLIEAMAISLAGGLLGLLIVMLLVLGLGFVAPDLPIRVQPIYLLLGLVISCGIGLVAGISPAMRAADLNPVDALRSE